MVVVPDKGLRRGGSVHLPVVSSAAGGRQVSVHADGRGRAVAEPARVKRGAGPEKVLHSSYGLVSSSHPHAAGAGRVHPLCPRGQLSVSRLDPVLFQRYWPSDLKQKTDRGNFFLIGQ